MSKSLSSNVSQLYYNGFIPFCVYTTYLTLPHDSLMKTNKYYEELYTMQSSLYYKELN